MIKEFVQAWDANREKLREYISTHPWDEFAEDYAMMVRTLFEQVINPYCAEIQWNVFNLEMLHEIDDGQYHASKIFLLPCDDCEPSHFQYVATFVEYGSCSGCDMLLSINDYDLENISKEEQIKDYMTLFLHILQHCKWMFEEGETEDEEETNLKEE